MPDPERRARRMARQGAGIAAAGLAMLFFAPVHPAIFPLFGFLIGAGFERLDRADELAAQARALRELERRVLGVLEE